jgi:glutathione-regulated potassium-efflux system ancillary protein KefC
LLLGLFFIAVGMSIDFNVLMRSPLQLAAVLVAFLAIKAVVILTMARSMGMPAADRPVFTLLLAQGGEFAFVVFQAAAGAKVFDATTASLLVGAVALSMLLTPLVLVILDRFVLPRYAAQKNAGDMKPIDELQEAPIIVAGFGRYGQIVARLLMANGIKTTILDHDAQRIESARSFGYRVFYGDATRLDLLRLAGAETAKVIVVAVDGREAANDIVDAAQAHFGQAKLVVRVRDVTHAYDLLDRGVQTFDRELYESSLRSSRRVLDALGIPGDEAHRMVQKFNDHNLALMQQLHTVRHDDKALVSAAKQGRANLEQQMLDDRRAERQGRTAADSSGMPAARAIK